MWHLVHGNRVRNCHDRRLETRWMRSPKVALLTISMDSVQYNTEHCGINDDTDDEHREFRCSRNRLSSQNPLCWFNEYVHVHVVVLQRSAYRILYKVQVLVNEFCLFWAFYRCHFLHDFHTWGVTFKGKALATKCLFQNYSQLLDICTRLVLKTGKEIYFAKCKWFCTFRPRTIYFRKICTDIIFFLISAPQKSFTWLKLAKSIFSW